MANKTNGTRRQACDFDFLKVYGQIGKGFIEAHHLRPIASLDLGIAVSYESAKDFAVLCANCHRMIHRWPDPADVIGFKGLITRHDLQHLDPSMSFCCRLRASYTGTVPAIVSRCSRRR